MNIQLQRAEFLLWEYVKLAPHQTTAPTMVLLLANVRLYTENQMYKTKLIAIARNLRRRPRAHSLELLLHATNGNPENPSQIQMQYWQDIVGPILARRNVVQVLAKLKEKMN